MQRRGKLKLAGLVIVVFGLVYGAYIGLLFGYAAYDEKEGKAAWESYKVEAAKRGVKFKVREYLRGPIPDEVNFGASPLFARAFASEEGEKVFELPFQHSEDFKRVKSAQGELEAWRTTFARAYWIKKSDIAAAPAAVLKVLDQKFGKPWGELLQDARRPDCIFPVSWEEGTTVPLPHLTVLMAATRHAAIRARIALVEGNSAGALELWKLIWRLGKSLEKEPIFLSMLVKWSLQSTCVSLLNDGFELRTWKDGDLKAMEEAMREADPIADFPWMVNTERAHLTDEFLHNKERRNGNIRGYFAPDSKPSFFDRLASIYFSVLQLNLEADEALKDFDAAGHLYLNEALPPMDVGRSSDSRDKRRYLLYRIANPGYTISSIRQKTAFVAVELDQARVACALERFRLETGKYPGSTQELTPKYIDALPHDVIDGAPLRYRLEGESYVLYSVGVNETDENGKAKSGLVDEKDWTWGVTWR